MAAKRTNGEIDLATQLANRLREAVREERAAPPEGARDLPVLTGLDPSGRFLLPMEVVVGEAIAILRASKRVYSYGNAVVMETTAPANQLVLKPLRTEASLEASAVSLAANLLLCEHATKKGEPLWFPPPAAFLAVLLNAEPLARQLPRISLYSRRPLFGPDYELLNPGYHGSPGYLIHGTEIEPDMTPPTSANDPIERLPRHLRALLSGFCFSGPADVANTLAFALTGVLSNHFLDGGKPLALVDGNQPGVGKTLLMRSIGVVTDGGDPRLIHYTADDEELQKRICATLRPGTQSMIIVDNAKSSTGTPVSSPALEANSVAPEISLRILGVSQNYTRPNDCLWTVTMNQTRVSPDLVSRGLPIRLAYTGDPGKRKFGRADPIRYAREHRTEILAELFGFVARWNQAGRPRGDQTHRLHEWASLLGGIMNVNGFPEFLANYEEASQAFNCELEELSTLAELVLADPAGPHVTLAKETA
jgi:hypothetical protein